MNEIFKDSIDLNEHTVMTLHFRNEDLVNKALFWAQIDNGDTIQGFALDAPQAEKLRMFLARALRTSYEKQTNKIFEENLDELIYKKVCAENSREISLWEVYENYRKKFLNRWSPR